MFKSDETRQRTKKIEDTIKEPDETSLSLMSSYPKSRKSTCVAYTLWLVGGWCGLHQLYLRRDRHAFLIWSTAGGYLGFGLLRDLWKIPEYVRDANDDHAYVEELKRTVRKKKKVCYFFKCLTRFFSFQLFL